MSTLWERDSRVTAGGWGSGTLILSCLCLVSGFCHQYAVAAPGDRVGEVEAFEPAVKRAATQTKHLGGCLLVSSRANQGTRDMIPLHSREQILLATGGA